MAQNAHYQVKVLNTSIQPYNALNSITREPTTILLMMIPTRIGRYNHYHVKVLIDRGNETL
jgi:hypothetical protein